MAKTQDLLQCARDYAVALERGDLEAACAYLGAEAVFDLYPISRRFSGAAKIRRHIQHFLTEALPRIVGAQVVSEWVSEAGLAHEIDMTVSLTGAESPSTHRIFRIMTFGSEQLSGERIYGDPKILRFLIGSLWNSLEPIPED